MVSFRGNETRELSEKSATGLNVEANDALGFLIPQLAIFE